MANIFFSEKNTVHILSFLPIWYFLKYIFTWNIIISFPHLPYIKHSSFNTFMLLSYSQVYSLVFFDYHCFIYIERYAYVYRIHKYNLLSLFLLCVYKYVSIYLYIYMYVGMYMHAHMYTHTYFQDCQFWNFFKVKISFLSSKRWNQASYRLAQGLSANSWFSKLCWSALTG